MQLGFIFQLLRNLVDGLASSYLINILVTTGILGCCVDDGIDHPRLKSIHSCFKTSMLKSLSPSTPVFMLGFILHKKMECKIFLDTICIGMMYILFLYLAYLNIGIRIPVRNSLEYNFSGFMLQGMSVLVDC